MCGIFGIYNNELASWNACFGLTALQHRGQESAGIAVSADGKVNLYAKPGRVENVFNEEILEVMGGNIAIGHVRYSTVAGTDFVQPVKVDKPFEIALGHNGQINFSPEYRERLRDAPSSNDSERLLYLISNSKEHNIEDKVQDILTEVMDIGSYALVVIGQGKLIGARDPRGYRPLSLGKIGDSYVLASETCAFDTIEAEFIRDIKPGEIVTIDENGLNSRYLPEREFTHCIFELIYFARPDSYVYGKNVATIRRVWGRVLAEEHPADADIVLPVPDSGNEAAVGYSEQSGIPLNPFSVIRNRYIHRTFISPQQVKREQGVRLKLNPNKEFVNGKRAVVTEDSIVRATTLPIIIEKLRKTGVSEVHVRVSSPPYCSPCYYGIDTPKKEELAAAKRTVEEIRELIGADSLGYLSLDGMLEIKELEGMQFCRKCFL